MSQFKEVSNDNGYSNYVAKNTRWQKIKWTKGGEPYVTRHGERYHLDLFESREDGRAYHFLTYSSCITLEIDSNGEMGKVGYEFTGRSSNFWKTA